MLIEVRDENGVLQASVPVKRIDRPFGVEWRAERPVTVYPGETVEITPTIRVA